MAKERLKDLIPPILLDQEGLDYDGILTRTTTIMELLFDDIRLQLQQLPQTFNTNYTDYDRVPNGLMQTLFAQTYGIQLSNINNSISSDTDNVTFQIWNRILNNLMYILKSKGTKQAVRYCMTLYGIDPNRMSFNQYVTVKSGDTYARQNVSRIPMVNGGLISFNRYGFAATGSTHTLEMQVKRNTVGQLITFPYQDGVFTLQVDNGSITATLGSTVSSLTSSLTSFSQDSLYNLSVKLNGTNFQVNRHNLLRTDLRSSTSIPVMNMTTAFTLSSLTAAPIINFNTTSFSGVTGGVTEIRTWNHIVPDLNLEYRVFNYSSISTTGSSSGMINRYRFNENRTVSANSSLVNWFYNSSNSSVTSQLTTTTLSGTTLSSIYIYLVNNRIDKLTTFGIRSTQDTIGTSGVPTGTNVGMNVSVKKPLVGITAPTIDTPSPTTTTKKIILAALDLDPQKTSPSAKKNILAALDLESAETSTNLDNVKKTITAALDLDPVFVTPKIKNTVFIALDEDPKFPDTPAKKTILAEIDEEPLPVVKKVIQAALDLEIDEIIPVRIQATILSILKSEQVPSGLYNTNNSIGIGYIPTQVFDNFVLDRTQTFDARSLYGNNEEYYNNTAQSLTGVADYLNQVYVDWKDIVIKLNKYDEILDATEYMMASFFNFITQFLSIKTQLVESGNIIKPHMLNNVIQPRKSLTGVLDSTSLSVHPSPTVGLTSNNQYGNTSNFTDVYRSTILNRYFKDSDGNIITPVETTSESTDEQSTIQTTGLAYLLISNDAEDYPYNFLRQTVFIEDKNGDPIIGVKLSTIADDSPDKDTWLFIDPISLETYTRRGFFIYEDETGLQVDIKYDASVRPFTEQDNGGYLFQFNTPDYGNTTEIKTIDMQLARNYRSRVVEQFKIGDLFIKVPFIKIAVTVTTNYQFDDSYVANLYTAIIFYKYDGFDLSDSVVTTFVRFLRLTQTDIYEISDIPSVFRNPIMVIESLNTTKLYEI